jgi:hypothetical protein
VFEHHKKHTGFNYRLRLPRSVDAKIVDERLNLLDIQAIKVREFENGSANKTAFAQLDDSNVVLVRKEGD